MKTYSINDIIHDSDNVQDYFVAVFEDTADPEIEWGTQEFLSEVPMQSDLRASPTSQEYLKTKPTLL